MSGITSAYPALPFGFFQVLVSFEKLLYLI
jgi:hypothetical protein